MKYRSSQIDHYRQEVESSSSMQRNWVDTLVIGGKT